MIPTRELEIRWTSLPLPVGSFVGLIIALAAVTAAAIAGGSVFAQPKGVNVGTLSCTVAGGVGFIFGLARGFLLVAIVFILFTALARDQPEWVRNARSYPLLQQTQVAIESLLPMHPEEYLPGGEDEGEGTEGQPEGQPGEPGAPEGAPAQPDQPS